MKHKLLLLLLLFCSLAAISQKLASIYQNSNFWKTSSSGHDSRCSSIGYYTQTEMYQIDKDTVIDNVPYKILLEQYKRINFPCGETQTTSSKAYIGQSENVIYKYNGTQCDTIFRFSGLKVGDSAYFENDRFLYLTEINIVTVGGNNFRQFRLSQQKTISDFDIFYIDRVGFLNSGPLPSTTPRRLFEINIKLDCFKYKTNFFQVGNTDQSNKFSFTLSSQSCFTPLGIQENSGSDDFRIFVNNLNELESNVVLKSVSITDVSGKAILVNYESDRTSLAGLKPGIYIAKVYHDQNYKSYKFIIN